MPVNSMIDNKVPWIDKATILVPLSVCGLSAILLLIHFLVFLVRRRGKPDAEHGRSQIIFKSITALGCLASVALSAIMVVGVEEDTTAPASVFERPFVGLCLAFVYASALSIWEMTSKSSSSIVSYHLSIILFIAWTVLFARDIAPLGTFTEHSLDKGLIPWSLIGIQTFVAVVLPLLTPRIYVPLDPKDPMPPNPSQTTPILSFAFFSYLDPLIWKAYTVPRLTINDLPPLADRDHIKNLVKTSTIYLDPHSGVKSKSSVHIMFKLLYIFRKDYVLVALFLILENAAVLAAPYGLKGLLTYLQTGGEGAILKPWVWISFFFLAPLTSSICSQQGSFLVFRITTRIEALVTQLLLEHALRIRVVAEAESSKPSSSGTATPVESQSVAETSASGAESQATLVSPSTDGEASNKAQALVGRMNNLISTDLQSIARSADFMSVVFSAPLIVIGSLFFLYQLLGWSVLVGFALMIVQLPFPGFVGSLLAQTSREMSKRGDERIEAVTETMSVIRMIKMFGWEKRMAERLEEKRGAELKAILKNKVYGFITIIFGEILPAVTTVVTYGIYALVMKQTLDAAIVFASISLFTLLRWRVTWMIQAVPNLIRGKISLDRVSNFLTETELLDKYVPEDATTQLFVVKPESDSKIGFRAATFKWTKESGDGKLTPSKRSFKLYIEDELLFKRGAINLVVGPTGCGKTSMLLALLGEMHFVPSSPNSWFNLPRGGGVAYATQESWVMNATIRDNVLFEETFDKDRYDAVINQCGLTRDLSLFDAGDLTEVGEKGLTLSGGQKARVTLARVIYSQAEILLLDDIFAALDVHTAKWIVQKCLSGDLVRGRTVILATHNVKIVAPVAEFVVSIGSSGQVLSQGSMADALIKNPKLKVEVIKKAEIEEKAEGEIDTQVPDDTHKEAANKLIVEEEVADGHVSFSSVTMYLSALGGRYPLFFWIGFSSATFFECFIALFQPYTLGAWANEYLVRPPEEVNVTFYLSTYFVLVVMVIVVYCTAQLFLVKGSLRASKSIHERLVKRVLRTTLRWLDRNPTSRLLTRCTQDVAAIDTGIPESFSSVFESCNVLFIEFLGIVYFAPIVGVIGVMLFVAGATLGNIYMKSQLSVKREMSKAKAPVMAHFGAAIEGLPSIRAYGAEESVKLKSMARIDDYSRTSRVFNDLSRWINIRINVLGGMLSVFLGVYFVYGRSGVSAANSGFVLTLTTIFGFRVLWFVQALNQFEVNGNSLERVQEYMSIEQEKEWSDDAEPPAYWPSSGALRVEGLSAKYSADGPEILHQLSFNASSGEHIGIVGKTGSGKSSLALSLFRCIPTDGEVYYDNLPTSAINLDTLRSHITIIPQIPELMSGTLRQNLDPFDQFDDVVLMNALRASGLYTLQSDADEGRITLDSVMSREGSNLSVGQRQIIALARAMVRDSKLLILDEATSAIDYKTDAVIQESLRKELKKDVTVITIAHRLQTIMDADKIMVLDAGRIVEFDSPKVLLEDKRGFLHSLVEESGDRDALYAAAGVVTV